jgi:AraC-like DNA-binding protein
VLGCPVRFGRPIGEFVVARRYLDAPLMTANADLHRLVRRHAEDLLARIPTEANLIARARASLTELLPTDDLSIATLARRLRVSQRTLQRKLRERELSYRQLVDDTRQELALRHLEAGAMTVSELAFRLGFRSLPAFARAFHRWRGMTPSDYQRQARARLSGGAQRTTSSLLTPE